MEKSAVIARSQAHAWAQRAHEQDVVPELLPGANARSEPGVDSV